MQTVLKRSGEQDEQNPANQRAEYVQCHYGSNQKIAPGQQVHWSDVDCMIDMPCEY